MKVKAAQNKIEREADPTSGEREADTLSEQSTSMIAGTADPEATIEKER